MEASSLYLRSISRTGRRWTYDVFLSFRGEDTRKNFLDHLYTALDNRGIYTYKDDKRLLTGEPISGQLSAAIEDSRVAVVIFSPNYADSSWCLDEVAHIRDCRNEFHQTVIPVFYNVDPSQVRRQLESYGEALEKHEIRYRDEKIQRWKDALFEVACLSGFDVSKTSGGHESKCITKIVEKISSICLPIPNCERNLVGINSRVQDLKSQLGTDSNVVRFVGIWGLGGAGKTTLAWAVYNEISYQFEGRSFLENVKEVSKQYSGLQLLQKKVLSEILFDQSLKVSSIREGIGLMGSRLRRRKVLLVLDDVDDDAQLDALAASHEWFGKGSRIIITTRDQRWLTRPTSIEMYNASLLNHAEAVKLFSLYAFGKDSPPEEYKYDAHYLVRNSGGFPLALKVLGASLYDSTMNEWKSTLSRLDVEGEDEVSKMLKVSYDGLSEIDRKILLDIACFFKGEKKDHVTKILDSFDFHAHSGIKRLVQRSLIFVSNSRIHMHDRIQEMGWHIVRKNSDEPGEYSRLWLPHDVCHVLTENTGTDAVEGICLYTSSGLPAFKFDTKSFRNMNKLRLLVLNNKAVPKKLGRLYKANKYIRSKLRSSVDLKCLSNLRWLTWDDYSLDSLPEFLGTSNLVGLEMPRSQIMQLWKEGEVTNGRKILDKLRFINLLDSRRLQQTQDFNFTPNLQTLILKGCTNLVEVHPSIGDHGQLVFLSLRNCINLESLPSSIQMKSLETLILSHCWKLKRFPDIKGNMQMLSELHLNDTSIEELPESVGNLSGLVLLDLTSCRSLTSLPSTICKLKCLKTLYLSMCDFLEKLPENLGQIQSLEELRLDYFRMREAPSSMGLLKNLKTLSVCSSTGVMRSLLWKSYPNPSRFGLEQPLLLSFCSIRSLFLDCCNLSDGVIPADLSSLSTLEELYLGCNLFKSLPEGICHLPRLKILDVSGCESLVVFEAHLPSGIAVLKADRTANMISFPDLSTKYDSLWKISCINCYVCAEEPANIILRSLLQGLLVANHRFSLLVNGCHIPKWFREQRPQHHPRQLPLNWYKEDILGFAISTVFRGVSNYGYMDIRFDFIEENTWKYVPQTSSNEPLHCESPCEYHKLWVGFVSFNFFKLLFPEFQPDDWSTYTSTIGLSFYDVHGVKIERSAIRAVYKEDVERVPMIEEKSAHYDPTGRPWLEHYLTYEDSDYTSNFGRYNPRDYRRSLTTAYLKEKGQRHARLLLSV